MMRKVIMFAACAAAGMIVASCSSEDALTETGAPVVTGKPFVVNVVDDGTRGVDITSISAFKLVGKQAGASDNWIDNYMFTKPSDKWVTTDVSNLSWPTTDGAHTFYGICDNTNSVTDITDGKFTYTVPTDISAQKDLLVTTIDDVANESDDVSLAFKHALSSVKFKVGYDADWHSGVMDVDQRASVRKITLYHIPTSGTFDFSKYAATDNSQWKVSESEPGYVNYEITFAEPYEFTPINPQAENKLTDDKATFKSMLTPLSSTYIPEEIFILPHKPTAWNPNASLSGSYIGVEALVYRVDSDETWYSYEGVDEADPDDLDSYKADYVAKGGTLNTNTSDENDPTSWASDYEINIVVPTDVSMVSGFSSLPTMLSGLNANKNKLYQEIYFPLNMKNGFGFGKTNILTISIEQARMSNGEQVIQGVDLLIE